MMNYIINVRVGYSYTLCVCAHCSVFETFFSKGDQFNDFRLDSLDYATFPQWVVLLPECALVLGHLKIINFPFVPNGKFIIFRCPKISAEYSLIIMCLNIRTPKNH